MEPTIISAIKEIGAMLNEPRRLSVRARGYTQFGWRYWNKLNSWNWLAGLTHSK